MVWYFHLFQNFPQLIVIHTVKGFGIVNKAEIDVFLELSCFFYDPADVIYTPKFIAALFMIAKTCRQPKCASADEWIKKMLHLE